MECRGFKSHSGFFESCPVCISCLCHLYTAAICKMSTIYSAVSNSFSPSSGDDPVELTDDFPREQPIIVLHSVYHRLEGFPCQSVVSDYPYSPRWSAEEKAERIR